MFRRRWSGLPADPVFPADLQELGYFVNEVDEVRSIQDPTRYFKFFINKNDRWNERQRFAMNQAVEGTIHARLENLGLRKLPLPLTALSTSPHIPIFATPFSSATPTRLVLIFGESSQDLGILAYRVASGPGGLDDGSMVCIVRALLEGRSSAADPRAPAVVLANPGQLWWWPEGHRPLTHAGRHAIPLPSAVHWGRPDDRDVNAVPRNGTVGEHVRCVFEDVARSVAGPDTRIDVVAVGDAADEVEMYLDGDDVWREWGPRMSALALLGGFCKAESLQSQDLKRFLRRRARAYIIHHDPLGQPVAGPDGDPGSPAFTRFGCPVFSAGPEAPIVELLMPKAYPEVLRWMQEVALAGEGYRNPHLEVISPCPTREEGWGEGAEVYDWEEGHVPLEREGGQRRSQGGRAARHAWVC